MADEIRHSCQGALREHVPFEMLMNATKKIANVPQWSQPEPETGYIWFNVPIEIGGVTEAAVLLRGGCYQQHVDKHVTFELCATNAKKKIPLQRVDWRSLNGGHSNKVREGCPMSGKRVSDSHIHKFELNWSQVERRMRGSSLPQADDLPSRIQSFESLIAFCGAAFRFSNFDIVSTPPWEYNLFENG